MNKNGEQGKDGEVAMQQPEALPVRGEYLIRGAVIVSLDAPGTLPGGDIHIKDGAIAAIGPDLVAPQAEVIDGADMIAMPGFIDTHWHMWSSVMRNFISDDAPYYTIKGATSAHYTPEDFYRSDMLALAEAINCGVTSVLNFSHNTRSPEHAAAEIRAHAESGVRALYAYGNPDRLEGDKLIDLENIEHVYRTQFSPPGAFDSLVSLALGLRGPKHTPQAVFTEEMGVAHRLGLRVAIHGGQTPRSTVSAVELRDQGFLDSRFLLTHFLLATEADRKAMAETGACLSFNPHSELRFVKGGSPQRQLLQMVRDGVTVALGCDANSVAPVNMFEAMRVVWAAGTPWDNDDESGLTPLGFHQALEMATINGARALGLELAAGKRADILLVRSNDLNMAPAMNPEPALVLSARPENIDTVFIDGRILKRHGKLTGLDVARIRREAARTALALRQKAGGVNAF